MSKGIARIERFQRNPSLMLSVDACCLPTLTLPISRQSAWQGRVGARGNLFST